ncbi:MAG: porin, partial [Pseudomonadota bacterium]
MRLVLIGAVAVFAASPTAFAELEGEVGPWTYEVGGEAVTVISVGDADGVDREPVLFELGMKGGLELVLDNGAEIGVRVTWRGQRDHPARAGGAGCLSEAGGPAVGVFSGAAIGCDGEDSGPRGSIEGAYAYIDGGYGEVTAGRDVGIASRFYEGPRDVFTHARTADALLDPSGQSFVRLRADLTGPAAKISYATPRLLGARAGVSFTPEANAQGLDWDPVRAVGGLARPQIESLRIRLRGERNTRTRTKQARCGIADL